MATLFVVATPIGNLEDLSPRAARVLAEAPVIAAEGVNRTRKLLSHLGLKKKVISCREANRKRAAREVVEILGGGRDVALVSDAGSPGLSDPGGYVVAQTATAGFRVSPIPGPSALAAALSVSGLEGAPHVFLGFLPSKPGARKKLAVQGAAAGWPLILYEAPHRLAASSRDLLEVLGDRAVVLCRELSKVNEEVAHTSLSALAKAASEKETRGEITLVIAGGDKLTGRDPEAPLAKMERLLQNGIKEASQPPSRLAKLVAKECGLTRDEVYQRLLTLKQEPEETVEVDSAMSDVPMMDNSETINKQLTVENGLGLHARVAARIADTVQNYDCHVLLVKGNVEAEGDSVLSILTLDAPKGSSLVIKAWGPQASDAVCALSELFAQRFGED